MPDHPATLAARIEVGRSTRRSVCDDLVRSCGFVVEKDARTDEWVVFVAPARPDPAAGLADYRGVDVAESSEAQITSRVLRTPPPHRCVLPSPKKLWRQGLDAGTEATCSRCGGVWLLTVTGNRNARLFGPTIQWSRRTFIVADGCA